MSGFITGELVLNVVNINNGELKMKSHITGAGVVGHENKAASSMSPMDQAILDLDQELSRLNSTVQRLHERLEPVTLFRPQIESAKNMQDRPPDPPRSKFVSRIGDAARSAEEIHAAVSELIDALQV